MEAIFLVPGWVFKLHFYIFYLGVLIMSKYMWRLETNLQELALTIWVVGI